MRRMLLAAVFSVSPTLAMADQSIAGPWEANVGHGVEIHMDILADGHWWSSTVQDNKEVAQLAGTYKQEKKNDTSGTLVFTPVQAQSKTTQEHGPAKVEEDSYTLAKGGKELKLVTGGETMDFRKSE
jgi:hypothetical protein